MVRKATFLVGVAIAGFAIVALIILAVKGMLPLTRRHHSNRTISSAENDLTCRIARTLIALETGGDDESFECYVVSQGEENALRDMSYPIDLPRAVVIENRKAIDDGQLYIHIPGGYVNEQYVEGLGRIGIDVHIPEGANIKVLQSKEKNSLRRPHEFRGRKLYAKGVRSVMVFRVTTDDASPDVAATEVGEKIFSRDSFSFAHQFDQCSFGQLEFHPVDSRTLVNELYVPGEVSSFTERSILTAAMRVATNIYGDDMWDNLDHAVFCMPDGTSGKPYIAYSGVGSFFSVFHNTRCAYPTTVMHEIAHNLGLGHAFEKGEEYGDETSIMGFSSSSRYGPRKCFNGVDVKHLGWFNNRAVSVDPFQGTQLVELAAFVDYDQTYSNQAVLISIFDIHLLYNRAKSFNAETSEYGDKLTITQEQGDINSDLIGALGTTEPIFTIGNYLDSGRTLHIEICNSFIGTRTPDYVLLSIGLDYGMCPAKAATSKPYPTTMPTKANTWAPTYHPTRAPSQSPTIKRPLIVLETNSPTMPTPDPVPGTDFVPVTDPDSSQLPDEPERATQSPSNDPSLGRPEKDAVIPSLPPKKPNLYDRPQVTKDATPTALPAKFVDADGETNGFIRLESTGETVAMIFCAASLALFTICCMLAIFKSNQRRLDEQQRNMRILEYAASSQIKLYMKDPV